MIASFYLKNYRLFQELYINSFERINVIVGMNNVGKSSLLEAIHLYLRKQALAGTLYQQSQARNEWIPKDFKPQNILNCLRSVFYGRKVVSDDQERPNVIYLGVSEQAGVSFYLKKIHPDYAEDQQMLVIEDHAQKKEIPLSEYEKYLSIPVSPHVMMVSAHRPMKYFNTLSQKWGRIALTEKEPFVIEALQLIDEQIEGVAFIDEGRRKKGIVKLRGLARPVSLGSMGEGVMRILRTILALVRCENGTLLIDEVETGLHWSVQAKLWKVMCQLAHKLNIRIFVTTHSRDTIGALQQVAFADGYAEDIRVLKLKFSPKTRRIKPAEFEIGNVKLALEQGIEIR